MSKGLETDLSLTASTAALLERYGFDRETFELLRERLSRGEASEAGNAVRGRLEGPHDGDITALPKLGSPERKALTERGEAMIRQGLVAVVVLTGGMATRFGGVVKAAVEVARGHTFLDLKLADIRNVAERVGGRVPVYLMTSFATHHDVTRLAAAATGERVPVEAFPQFVSLRLNEDGTLFRDSRGEVSPYAPGHGDLSFALRRSGVLAKMQARGVTHVFMSNVDNLAATLDPAIIAAHVASGKSISIEAADKAQGDKGGAPAYLDGVLQVIEGFRFPATFDQDSIPYFSVNSFVMDAGALDRDFDLSWFVVKKEVDGKKAIQFERLVGQLTAFLPCNVIAIAREGDDGRFMPVKDPPELAARKDSIVKLLELRGVL